LLCQNFSSPYCLGNLLYTKISLTVGEVGFTILTKQSEVKRMFTVAILTVSDKGFRGEREDRSGKTIREMVFERNAQISGYAVVPDEKGIIADKLARWADEGKVDVVLTTGGTGLSPRDVTPEATLSVVERLVPGISEAMRIESLRKTPRAMLSRAVAGTRKKTLIINLPGSPKAVRECLEVVLPVLEHAVEIIKGGVGECGS
jgi:molybdenum cofactor synthesis domain-containing protein